MKKRRTRHQKESANHNLTINWNEINLGNSSKTRLTEANVKRQKENVIELKNKSKSNVNNANYMDKVNSLRSIKLDLVKSMVISFLIIAIELVLYLTRV